MERTRAVSESTTWVDALFGPLSAAFYPRPLIPTGDIPLLLRRRPAPIPSSIGHGSVLNPDQQTVLAWDSLANASGQRRFVSGVASTRLAIN